MNYRNPLLTVAAAAVLCLALAATPVAAQASGCGNRGPSPERATQHLTERLALSAEQQEQVRTILETASANRDELRGQHRQEMDAMHDATEEQLAGVLTAAQMEQLGELRAERRDGRRGCDQIRECERGGDCKGSRDCGRGRGCWQG